MSDMVITITVNAEQFKKAMGLVQADLAKVDGKEISIETAPAQSSMSKLRDSVAMWGLAVNGAIMATKAIGNAINAVVAPALQQEQAQKELASALRNTGVYSVELEAKLLAQASAIQAVTTAGDDEIIMATRQMQVIGRLSSDEIPAAQKAAVGLAKAYKIDLETAFELVGKAAAGNTATLSRYGIVLDSSMSQTEKFSEVLRIGTESFGMATDEVAANYGALMQLQNLWGDFKELLGNVFLPVIGTVARALSGLLRVLNGGVSEYQVVTDAIIGQRVEFEQLVITYTRLRNTQNRSDEQNRQYKQTIAELMSKYPNYLQNIDLERDNWNKIANSIEGARRNLQLYINTRIQEAVVKEMESDIVKLSAEIVKKQTQIDLLKAEFVAGTKERTKTIKTAPDPLSGSPYGGTTTALSKWGEEEFQLERAIGKLTKKQQELNVELQKRMEVAQKIYALPPSPEVKVPAPGDPRNSVAGSGTGTAAALIDELPETSKAYEALLGQLRKYFSDAELARLDGHQKALAQVAATFQEEQGIVLAALEAKQITEDEAGQALTQIRSKYDSERLRIQIEADSELLELAKKRMDQAVRDEEAYYEQMKFADVGYYQWKRTQIQNEIAAMAISEDQKTDLLRAKLAELELLKTEADAITPEAKGHWFFSGMLGFDPDSKDDQAKIDAIKGTFRDLVSNATSMTTGLMNLSRQRRDEELKDIDARAVKERMTGQQILAEKTAINKRYEAEERRLRKINQALSLGQAAINIAEGVTKALAMGPIIGPIMAGVLSAMGVAQIAIIKAQKFASGGLFKGKGGERDDQNLAWLSNGEYVVNAAATRRFKPILDMINFNMAMPALPRIAYADGGMVGGGMDLAPRLDEIVKRLEILNLNIVKKPMSVVIENHADVKNTVRSTDMARNRMTGRGYVQDI